MKKFTLDLLAVIERDSQFTAPDGSTPKYINLLVRDVATGQTASWQTGEASLQPLKGYVGHRITAEGEIAGATELDAATGQPKPVLKTNGSQAFNFTHVRGTTVSYVGPIPETKMASFPAPAAAAA